MGSEVMHFVGIFKPKRPIEVMPRLSLTGTVRVSSETVTLSTAEP